MVTFSRPDVYVQEVTDLARPIEGVGTSISAFLGIAMRGPVNRPVLITKTAGGIKHFERIFGTAMAGHSLYYSVKDFFEMGGQFAWIVRLAHYDGSWVLQSQAASVYAEGVGVEAFASFVGNVNVTPGVNLDPGDSLTFDINNGGNQTATFNAVAATLTGSGGAFLGGQPGATAQLRINGGEVQDIDLSAVGAGVAAFIDELNIQCGGCFFEEDTGEIKQTTDRKGSSASIEWLNLGADFLSETGIGAGTVASAGPNNVADIDNVTFAELKTVIEDAIKTATPGDKMTVTQEGNGFLVLTNTAGSPGPANEIDLVSATGAIIAALGLSALGSQGGGSEAVGSSTAAANSLQFRAAYRDTLAPGLDGNNLSVDAELNPLHPSAGAGNDLLSAASSGQKVMVMASKVGLVQGSYLKISDGVNTEYGRVDTISTAVVGSQVQHTITLLANLTYSYATVNTTIESQEHDIVVYYNAEEVERWPQTSMNPDLDNYVETLINDDQIGSIWIQVEDQSLAFPANILAEPAANLPLTGGTDETSGFADTDVTGDETNKIGLYALDEVDDVNILCVPPNHKYGTNLSQPAPAGPRANAVTQVAMLDYAEARFDMFAVLDMPQGRNPETAKSYRNNELGVDTQWGALYYPFIERTDPLGKGRRPKVQIPPSGAVAGNYARVDSIAPPKGGAHTAPAGEGDFGKVKNALGLEYYVSDREHGPLNEAGINCIRRFTRGGPAAPGILIWGARTLSTDKRFRYVQNRRFMTFIEQSVRIGTRFAVFRDNDFRLWEEETNIIRKFLKELHANGQLKGRTADEAYFIKIDDSTNTADAIDNGQNIGEIGVALIKPAEFVIFKFYQIQSGGSGIDET